MSLPLKKILKFRTSCQFSGSGFTLVELLIALLVSTLVVGAVYVLFTTQQNHYVAQSQVTEMQQNIRAGATMMESDMRMVGYDPEGAGTATFALLDIRKRNSSYTVAGSGDSAIQFSVDLNEDGSLDDPDEIITYSLADYPDSDASKRDGVKDLTRATQSAVYNNRELIAENIIALGIAYGFDSDGDGELETSTNGNVILAVDTDNDNILDVGLDTNDDGVVDIDDTQGGSALTAAPFNTSALPPIELIRSAKVWALARSSNRDPDFLNSSTYVIAEKHITVSDSYRRRILEFSIYFRNTGL